MTKETGGVGIFAFLKKSDFFHSAVIIIPGYSSIGDIFLLYTSVKECCCILGFLFLVIID